MLSAERPAWVRSRWLARVDPTISPPRLTSVDLGGVQALAALVALGADPIADHLLPDWGAW
tara:strand:- start:1612 stop:1794 length:183 start_codon:yes stop_codon:yes gene_type:complete